MATWYEQQTTASRSRLKRFAHRQRFRHALRMLPLAPGQSLLDYGAGDGVLLTHLRERHPDAELWGYEPGEQFHALAVARTAGCNVRLVRSVAELAGRTFDAIACTEVLEHFPPGFLEERVRELVGLLRPGGALMVSVPIETGPASLAKNLVRLALGQADAGLPAVAWAALGRTGRIVRVPRGHYVPSHVGFDHHAICPLLQAQGLELEATAYSPLPIPSPWVNSQVIWRLRKPH